jgi:transcriptional regulator with XRE-family HTH domain
LGQKLAQIRKLRSLTQRQLAEKLNVAQTMVTRWEKDYAQPKSDTLQSLARILETPVEKLLSSKSFDHVFIGTDNIADPRLAELLQQVHKLETNEQEALRLFLDALLTKRNIQEMLGNRKSA